MGQFNIFKRPRNTPVEQTAFSNVARSANKQPQTLSNTSETEIYSVDPELFELAVRVIFETKQASVSMTQRRLHLGYGPAAELIDAIEEAGIIGPFIGTQPRKILITKEQYLQNRTYYLQAANRGFPLEIDKSQANKSALDIIGFENDADYSTIEPEYVVSAMRKELENAYSAFASGNYPAETISKILLSYKEKFLSSKLPPEAEAGLESLMKEFTQRFQNSEPLYLVNHMNGQDFEKWCASLLNKCGFSNVELTKTSGDQGVDILAEKDEIRYAIQCKCYSSNLGNAPVQEVNAGKALYNCHVGVVMTNSHFTQGAKDLAKATGTLLWDRDKLNVMIKKSSDHCTTAR